MEVLGELTAKGVGCVLVVSGGGALQGTFTDGDLRRALQSRGAQARAVPGMQSFLGEYGRASGVPGACLGRRVVCLSHVGLFTWCDITFSIC